MTYKKPNLKYTDMCKYFDEHFHVDPSQRDDTLLYEYMYHIIYMLACKSKFFMNYRDYDEFAVYASNMLYTRFAKFDRENKPIKSILNYAKASLYPLKATYIRSTKSWALSNETGFDTVSYADKVKATYQYNYNNATKLSDYIIETIQCLPAIAADVVLNTPYKTDKLMVKRLYQSCLLTLINEFTMTNHLRTKIDRRNSRSLTDLTTEEELYLHKQTNTDANHGVILWQLDCTYNDYIKVLTTRIKKALSNELTTAANEYRLEDNILDAWLKNFTDPASEERERTNDY